MKPIFPVGLLVLVLGCSSSTAATSSQKLNLSETAPTSIAQSTSPSPAEKKPTSGNQNAYQSDRFGFGFSTPDGYVVDNSRENSQTKPGETWQGSLEIWQTADFPAIQAPNFEGGEYPPNISISVHSNAEQLPLSQWQERLSIGSDGTRPLTVAGQDAIAYRADGLYGSDNVLLTSSDRRSVIHLSRGYIDPSDPSRQAFQQVVSSFRFNR